MDDYVDRCRGGARDPKTASFTNVEYYYRLVDAA